jgi:hypothetical protein
MFRTRGPQEAPPEWGHALFRALVGTLDPGTDKAGLVHAFGRAAVGRVASSTLHALLAAVTRGPCAADRALQCVAHLHTVAPDLLWAPHGLWTERRERMTVGAPALAVVEPGPCDVVGTARRVFGALHVLRTVAAFAATPGSPHPVHALAQAQAALRLVCKPAAAALHPGTLLVGHGVPRPLHAAFLHRDAHGVAPWVRLALYHGAWVTPCKPGSLTAAHLAPQVPPCSIWLVVQWATSRCLLHVAQGVTQAVLSMTTCEPRPSPPYPPRRAALHVGAAAPGGHVDCTLHGFPHVLRVIAWATWAGSEHA